MTETTTARFALPLLAAGQAHKELFHNEAITLLDFLAHPVVETVANDPQSLTPQPGQCWLVGASPVDVWAGEAHNIAGWTDSGWRFLAPNTGMRVMIVAENRMAIFKDQSWASSDALEPPSGGAVNDQEARIAIDSILAVLQTHGLLPPLL